MNNKIIILFPISFPFGGAATNRIIQICKALNQEENLVKLYITRPTEKKYTAETVKDGFYEGIEYYHINKNIIWPNQILGKMKCLIFSLIKTLKILLREDYDIVISYGDYSYFNHFFYFLVIRARQKRIVYIVDEFPWSVVYNANSVLNKLYIKSFYRFFDAIIVMTFTLMDYYSTKIRKNSKMFHLPMTVEVERFNTQTKSNILKLPYIAYCGYDIFYKNGSIFSKDGVEILIEAFSIVSKKFDNLLLYIIGETNLLRYQQVEKLNLKDKVCFIGAVNREQIPEYLCNAKLLVLARPNNIQAQGAFPTKLGEYLSTGNPVVVTKVGEIPLYLKDNWNAFLAEPGNVQSFAEKMDFALSNREIARMVGLRGKELAEKEFSYKKQGIKLKEFLNTLLE